MQYMMANKHVQASPQSMDHLSVCMMSKRAVRPSQEICITEGSISMDGPAYACPLGLTHKAWEAEDTELNLLPQQRGFHKLRKGVQKRGGGVVLDQAAVVLWPRHLQF